MKKLFLIYILVFAFTMTAFAGGADKVLAALKQVKSYSADFVQATEIEGFGEDIYSGKLIIKSGERALWDYDKPYRQFYLFDTKTMQYYDSDTKQLIIQQLNPATNVFMRLMLDPSDIEDDFIVVLEGEELKLTPKEDLGIDSLVFVVEGSTVKGIKTKDQSGNNTNITFKNIVKDKPVSENAFKPEIPEGTEVFKYN